MVSGERLNVSSLHGEWGKDTFLITSIQNYPGGLKTVKKEKQNYTDKKGRKTFSSPMSQLSTYNPNKCTKKTSRNDKRTVGHRPISKRYYIHYSAE
jgi:hypothetical protein